MIAFFKLFFRELPDPVCTLALHEQLVLAVKLERMEERRAEVCSLLSHLPLPHLNTLAHLMKHLHLLSLSSSLTGMTPKNLAIVWAPNLLRSGGLVDEIRDIGAGSQLVELLVSEAPHLFQETYRLLSERLRRLHERLSCDGLDEVNQKLLWEKSQIEDTLKRQCCDRSIPGEEVLLCERLYQSQQNIGRQSQVGKHGLLCEGGQGKGEEEKEGRSERRMGRRLRGRNWSQVRFVWTLILPLFLFFPCICHPHCFQVIKYKGQ